MEALNNTLHGDVILRYLWGAKFRGKIKALNTLKYFIIALACILRLAICHQRPIYSVGCCNRIRLNGRLKQGLMVN